MLDPSVDRFLHDTQVPRNRLDADDQGAVTGVSPVGEAPMRPVTVPETTSVANGRSESASVGCARTTRGSSGAAPG